MDVEAGDPERLNVEVGQFGVEPEVENGDENDDEEEED